MCDNQSWNHVSLVHDPLTRKQLIIALQKFCRGNVVLDFHGAEVSMDLYSGIQDYCAEAPEQRIKELCIETKTGKQK